jgi:hypothetical protein
MDTQLSYVFGMKGSELKRNLYSGLLEKNAMTSSTLNSLNIMDCLDAMDVTFGGVDEKRACKRWFTGNLYIQIYQIDGASQDILKQQYKFKLKNFKTRVDQPIHLDGKVKRTMQKKRNDWEYMPGPEASSNMPKSG